MQIEAKFDNLEEYIESNVEVDSIEAEPIFSDISIGYINTYELAVKLGYTGTIEEWLASLKGDKGDSFTYADFTPEQLESLRGPKGDDGERGEKGKDGKDGTNGKDGADGKDGKDGVNGKTPVKGVDYFTEEDINNLGIDTKADKSELSDYATTKYVDDSLYDSMHRTRSVRKLNTHQRNFTDTNWSNYGSIGHVENWASTSNYLEFKVGDLGVLYGKNTTNGKYVALVGEVTVVTNSLQMRTVACYQTDEYKEVTEYGVDLADDLEAVIQSVDDIETTLANKADKSQIPTIPTNVSAFTNDAGYLTKHQDISGKLDSSTFETAWSQATTAMDEYGTNIQQLQLNKANVSEVPTKVSQLENDENYLAEAKSTDLVPLQKKTYQNIIATSNDNAGGVFYCFKVRPDSYYEPCRIKFKVKAYINESMTNSNKALFRQETYSTMLLSGNALIGYQNKSWYYSTSYRPFYYTSVYRTSKTGYDAGLPHYVGVNLYNSNSPTTATLKRDIEIELLEVEGCTVEMLDEMVKQSSFYNSTNYAGLSNCDAASAGVKQTGDNNNIDRLCYGSYLPKALGKMYGTQLVLSADGENYFSICTSRSTALTKTCNTNGFRPEHIMYYSNSATISNGNRVGGSTLYEVLSFDFRYSHNIKALTLHKPVYIKATYSDGLYYLATDGWMTQDLPTEEDGYYYILVGYSYTANNIYIKPVHPVYQFINGSFKRVYQ